MPMIPRMRLGPINRQFGIEVASSFALERQAIGGSDHKL